MYRIFNFKKFWYPSKGPAVNGTLGWHICYSVLYVEIIDPWTSTVMHFQTEDTKRKWDSCKWIEHALKIEKINVGQEILFLAHQSGKLSRYDYAENDIIKSYLYVP